MIRGEARAQSARSRRAFVVELAAFSEVGARLQGGENHSARRARPRPSGRLRTGSLGGWPHAREQDLV